MKLIGISGYKGSGKDTLAKFIMAYAPYVKYSMADPIRAIGTVMGFTDEEMLDPVKKELVSEFFGISWRKFAQWIGTDVMRDGLKVLIPDMEHQIWVKLAERQFDKHPTVNYVIPDIRFDDEAEMVKRRNGIMIQVQGRTTGNDMHPSERGVSPYLIDSFVHNTSSIEEFKNAAEIMVRAGVFDDESSLKNLH